MTYRSYNRALYDASVMHGLTDPACVLRLHSPQGDPQDIPQDIPRDLAPVFARRGATYYMGIWPTPHSLEASETMIRMSVVWSRIDAESLSLAVPLPASPFWNDRQAWLENKRNTVGVFYNKEEHAGVNQAVRAWMGWLFDRREEFFSLLKIHNAARLQATDRHRPYDPGSRPLATLYMEAVEDARAAEAKEEEEES
jgi:hypothetical protein